MPSTHSFIAWAAYQSLILAASGSVSYQLYSARNRLIVCSGVFIVRIPWRAATCHWSPRATQEGGKNGRRIKSFTSPASLARPPAGSRPALHASNAWPPGSGFIRQLHVNMVRILKIIGILTHPIELWYNALRRTLSTRKARERLFRESYSF